MPEARFLAEAERDALGEAIARDGFAVLPDPLPEDHRLGALAAIARLLARSRAGDPAAASMKVHDCIRADRAFLPLVAHPPALQLAYDAFGPMFHLAQSN